MAKTCNLSIENLAQAEACDNNMSGVTTLYFIPTEHVTAINAVRPATATSFEDYVVIGSSAMEGKAVIVATGKGFAKMYCADELGELKYTLQGASGSRSMKADLEVFHPGFKKKLLGFLATQANRELIVVCLLNNGEYHMLGDMRRGCKVDESSEATSGKATTDQNGATLHFVWNTPAPQILFDEFDPEGAKGLPLIGDES